MSTSKVIGGTQRARKSLAQAHQVVRGKDIVVRGKDIVSFLLCYLSLDFRSLLLVLVWDCGFISLVIRLIKASKNNNPISLSFL